MYFITRKVGTRKGQAYTWGQICLRDSQKPNEKQTQAFSSYIPVVMKLAHQGLMFIFSWWQLCQCLQEGRLCSGLEYPRNKCAVISMCWGFENILAMVLQSINLTVWDIHLDFVKPEICKNKLSPSIIFQESLRNFPLPVLALSLICPKTLNKALYCECLKFGMFSDQLYSQPEKVSSTCMNLLRKKTNHTFSLVASS